jgi:hypothetical protein
VLPLLFGRDGVLAVGPRWPIEPCAAGVSIALLVVGAGLIVGIYPRCCSVALFIANAYMSRFTWMVSSADDIVLGFTLLWLALTPIGHAVRPGRPIASWAGRRIPGHAVSLFLVFLLQFDVAVWFWQKYDTVWAGTPWVVIALWIAPGCILFPSTIVNRVGVAVTCAAHAVLWKATGGVAHGIFVASGIVLWSYAGERDDSVATEIDAGAAIGASYWVVLAAYVGGTLLGSGVSESAGRLLGFVGLLPTASGQHVGTVPRSLAVEVDEAATSPISVDWVAAGGNRAQLLLGYLEPDADGTSRSESPVTAPVVRGTVRRFCDKNRNIASGRLIFDTAGGHRPIAWFDCRRDAPSPSIVLEGRASVASHETEEPRAPRHFPEAHPTSSPSILWRHADTSDSHHSPS